MFDNHGVNICKDDSGRILVTFPYNPLRLAKVKTIEGHKWHKDKGFEDLRRELLSRKYSYKTVKGYLYSIETF